MSDIKAVTASLAHLRSLLFAPGSDEAKLTKALASGADAVVADLEDAVTPDRKELARELVRRLRPRVVRINGADTEWFADDLAAAAELELDALVLPKATPVAVDALGAEGPPVIAIVETAQGLRLAYETASRQRVEALALGAGERHVVGDLRDEIRGLRERGTTVFLTTQYLEEADVLADRVGIIDHGRIVAEGTPAALKAEVGRSTVEAIPADDGDLDRTAAILDRFGELVPSTKGAAVRLEDGHVGLAEIVRALHRDRGCTILMVEHHMEVLLGLVEKVAVMYFGSVIAFDEPRAVMADPVVQDAYLGSGV